jgi:hypothetical protein
MSPATRKLRQDAQPSKDTREKGVQFPPPSPQKPKKRQTPAVFESSCRQKQQPPLSRSFSSRFHSLPRFLGCSWRNFQIPFGLAPMISASTSTSIYTASHTSANIGRCYNCTSHAFALRLSSKRLRFTIAAVYTYTSEGLKGVF